MTTYERAKLEQAYERGYLEWIDIQFIEERVRESCPLDKDQKAALDQATRTHKTKAPSDGYLRGPLPQAGIVSPIIPIIEIQCGVEGDVVIVAVAARIASRDANDLAKVAKRGFKVSGPTMYLNMNMRDDSDEILCHIDRFHFDRLARPVIERGRAGKAIYALKGTVPPDFRMIRIDRIIYLGDMKADYVPADRGQK
jgi:hypothetical protein